LTKFDLKQFLMENSENMIDEIFISREDKLANMQKNEFKRLEKLNQKKESVINSLENIPETFKKTKSHILATFIEYTESANEINACTNEEYYKKGFKDGIRLIIESITKD